MKGREAELKNPLITLFVCTNSVDDSSVETKNLPSSITLQEIPCGSKVESIYLLKALENGADGILVITCAIGECRFREGNIRAGKRVIYTQELLKEAGIDGNRLRIVKFTSGTSEDLRAEISKFSGYLEKLNPLSNEQSN